MSNKKDMVNWLKTLPNKLTLGRIAVIPILLVIYPLDLAFLNVFSALLFALAAVTDYLDGYIARRYDGVSRLGAILDPIADKILVTAAVILLSSTGDPRLPAFIAALIICREIAVSGLRLAALEEKVVIEVSNYGKIKTFIQAVGIICLLSRLPSLHVYGMVAIWLSLLVSYYSAYKYWILFWNKQKQHF